MNGEIIKQQLQREHDELARFTALRYKRQLEEERQLQERLRRLEEVREEVKEWYK